MQETHGKRLFLFLWPVTEASGVRLTGQESKHAEHPSPAALTLIRRDAEGSAGLPKGTSAVGFEKKGKQAVAAVRGPESARPPFLFVRCSSFL